MTDENGQWDREEFEHTVESGLCALYETELTKISRQQPALVRVSKEELKWIRSVGPYFPAKDRVVDDSCQIDVVNDGLPSVAAYAYTYTFPNVPGEERIQGYCSMLFARRIQRLPSEARFRGPNIPYIFYHAYAHNKGGLTSFKMYLGVKPDGVVVHAPIVVNGQYGKEPLVQEGNEAFTFSSAITLFQDRFHLWNVSASDGTVHALFGVYEEEVKSLFYSRDLPMTETGRRRPILHWVRAHQRRMRSGIDVDIEKFLRGTDTFEMAGTEFTICRPQKTRLSRPK
jgi:hypothetical protein